MIRLHLSALRLCCTQDECTALESLPAMQRRRLSPLAKMAINIAMQTLEQNPVEYIVWVSRYGDETKTLAILQDVLTSQTPSPTQFSTSVHNAIAGLYSILCKDDTISTSLSCGWSEALIEAYAILKSQPQIKTVLLVYYDAPLPDIYQDQHVFEPFAMSTLIRLEHANVELSAVEQTQQIDALNFYAFWQDKHQTKLLGWQKC
ncbi:beta-ketoacyl synthase chain length factor [Acinetobacter sp. S40]|uniref:beta-ketoacyl synthase chain length factor n=1 Tax=unclassified Acinetobacter TaxID=196816 RepID=UPI00190DF735|nr:MULTISPECIES: beta-ketoacyl synthase chain length factor [unclassified Acinetobacter]MBJ9985581.1 beta-ketoacyl synthase chain length factor [Acinetobacter sp. S40]MBK0064619.1 beta-ketoacyl synthase chain length factor [Acinetobacter sp. S55]MBK0067992.1 beta-ketoacyl synthase chain length factor [Acinetobacter sp. S54]